MNHVPTTPDEPSPPPTPLLAPEPAPLIPRATFRPHERIRGKTDFQRVFLRKRSVSDPSLVLYAVENHLTHPRLGISVGRKRIRKSTGRNRVKRLIREAFRLTKPLWPPGVDYVVVPRTGELSLAQLQQSLPHLARAAAHRLAQSPPRPSRTDAR